ncbi:hypothetical protein [Mangrovitalea sediminis]|uniref:hypothetical protein n=1 Tax=Mangrovitalea sediminis TaxID=1982043 RepID=UPI000BE4C67C|nr:hypothetical protein [Mangrovitalea sediminis]
MMDDKKGFDCRFVLEGFTTFELGKEYEIAVGFLNPEIALENLYEGKRISLWEGKKIAVGVVKEILGGSQN